MTKSKAKDAARTVSRTFTDADMADVMDNAEATDEQLANLRPFADVFPELAASISQARNTRKVAGKRQVSLRLDQDVIERYKADGPGWQARMGEILKRAVGL